MYNTVVIGAGQAGLAMGYYLKQLKQPFVILDKAREVGEEWKKRYDSLVLFTPRMYNSLPGLRMKGDSQGFPAKDEIVNYLKTYADTFHLPIQMHTEVRRVRKENDYFSIETNREEFKASNVVIATGPFQKPRIPEFAKSLSPDIVQLHSSQYKSPDDLQAGNVLVVGGGNSGAQIAVELSKEGETYLSVSRKMKFLPLEIGNKSIFWWFDKLGILKASRYSWVGQKLHKKGDPIFGYELKEALQKGKVILKERALHGEENKILFEDVSSLYVQNIIWATGFIPNYSWLDIKGVLDHQGKPIQVRGKTPIKGLFFLGLPWQYRRGSALLQGVGDDAQHLLKQIQKREF
ncbi:flavin-containing monooxygenase [Bacillus thermotolerans]|uniref:Monooxygenase n=1 Tax=Bacillus thermotolerans TaxID=1221996 RepID=A0A0F5HN83_BACTR|nr:NAD(P)/FAD-dependent oxidoreductase [Bacillus thermotolerans]KKB34708.1 putative monooxygenase [Bacillus thermotolerans]KKB38777.1 monooxygenase [Bacillus thermotolerans]